MIPAYRFGESISIVNLGDVHRGNNNCDTGLLNKIVNYIRDHSHVYWVSTGDMLETALKGSKSSVYEASTVQEELDARPNLSIFIPTFNTLLSLLCQTWRARPTNCHACSLPIYDDLDSHCILLSHRRAG